MLFVPARTGSLYLVDVKTGASLTREGLDNRVQSISAAPLAEAVAVLSAGGSDGRIDIIPTSAPLADAPTDGEHPAAADTPEATHANDKRAAAPPVITRLGPASVQSGRRRDLPVTVVGSGFTQGATVVIGETHFSAAVGTNGKRANFTLPSAMLAAPASIPVQLRNADGSVSNAVNLDVVPPFSPLITSVRPKKLYTGNEGVDLRIVGDHFRDGALAQVTYVDSDGSSQTLDLKTYRLSFTSIVARLPQKLTRRALTLSLAITDRDGATTSAPESLAVVGPSVASVTPERVVAGDLDGGESLVLHISGENIHEDAAVFVKRPRRGADDGEATFALVPSSSVHWKSAERLIVTLAGSDVLYSGDLVLRIINPVAGEKRKNGDPVDATVTVAGPVVAESTPSVVIAGPESFFLKLSGTDFRRSAIIKITRDRGGESTKRVVVVDDPTFKDRKQINVEISSPQLLRLFARPGTLSVRVINGNSVNGDPSPPLTIQVVAPSILEAPQLSAAEDENYYKLKIKGQYFREGAHIQLYDANGAAVGHPLETRFKSDAELLALVSRNRVTQLRTFTVVVINPGGPYNGAGVPSNPETVTAN